MEIPGSIFPDPPALMMPCIDWQYTYSSATPQSDFLILKKISELNSTFPFFIPFFLIACKLYGGENISTTSYQVLRSWLRATYIYINIQFTKSSIQITRYYNSGCQMTGLVLHYIVVNKWTNIQISNYHLERAMKRKNSTKHVFKLDCWTWRTKEAVKHRAAGLLESKCQVWVSSSILNFWFTDDLQSHKSQKSSTKESHYDNQSQHPTHNTDKRTPDHL